MSESSGPPAEVPPLLPKNEVRARKLKEQTVRVRFNINPKQPVNRSRRYWRYLPEVPEQFKALIQAASEGALRTYSGGNVQPRTVSLRHSGSIMGELYLDVLEVKKLAKLRQPQQQDLPPAEVWVTVTCLWPEDL